MLINPLPHLFLLTYSQSMSALGCRLLYIFINFLIFMSILLTLSFLQLTILAEYLTLTKDTDHMLTALIILPPISSEQRIHFTRLKYSFQILSCISSCLIWSIVILQGTCILLLSCFQSLMHLVRQFCCFPLVCLT